MKNKGFNLIQVIIIICITSITSAITVGVIIKNSSSLSYGNLSNDKSLNEFLKAYSKISDDYYEDIDKDKMLDAAMDAMLNYLGDNYTTYLNNDERENLEELLKGTYKGIGIGISKNDERLISEVYEDGPAYEAGVKSGDIIVTIDNLNVENVDSDAIAALITNSKKDNVELQVKRGEELLDFNIPIKTLIKPAIEYNMIENTKIGYLKMKIFSKTLTTQVESALKDLEGQGMDRLIIDLRDNTGGFLDIASSVASLFLEKGKRIYSLEDKDQKEDFYDKTDEKRTYPIAMLLNNNSASASEILAAALKDSYGAVFVGTKSFGKGKVQQTYEMDDGSLAKFTTAKWLRPNGSCIDGIGLIPDYEIDHERAQDENGKEYIVGDKQKEKAIEIISAM